MVKAAKTGKVGDGKIFITEIDRVIRIRTGRTDDSALDARPPARRAVGRPAGAW